MRYECDFTRLTFHTTCRSCSPALCPCTLLCESATPMKAVRSPGDLAGMQLCLGGTRAPTGCNCRSQRFCTLLHHVGRGTC